MSKIAKPLTIAERTAAKQMRATGATWKQTADALGLSLYRLRCGIDPGYRERVHEYNGIGHQRHVPVLEPNELRPKREEALYDPHRDGVIPPPSTTAALCGDPWPGRRELLDRHFGGNR